MTVKDQRKDITISPSYSFFNHLEYFISLEKMKIESNSPPRPYLFSTAQYSGSGWPNLVPRFQSVLRWETWHDIIFGLNNLISQIVQAHSPGPTDCPWVSEDGSIKQE